MQRAVGELEAVRSRLRIDRGGWTSHAWGVRTPHIGPHRWRCHSLGLDLSPVDTQGSRGFVLPGRHDIR